MPTARSRMPLATQRRRGLWFMIVCLLVMAGTLTYLGWQHHRATSRHTSAAPASAPGRTTSPEGTGSGSPPPPANPNIDRNG